MRKNIGFTLSVALMLCACGNESENEKKQPEEKKIIKEVEPELEEVPIFSLEQGTLKVSIAPTQVEYPTAKLNLKKPQGKVEKAGSVVFDFEVLDYKLQEQTTGAKQEILANAIKGQHIHFIHNNAPYQAKYEPSFQAELLEGNNVVLAFLSKSFHESVKTETAFFFENFYIGEGESFFDKTAPHLFYSRPKGTYNKSKAQKILLDFYLVNTTLAETGNKVKLKVNEEEFVLPYWSAYFIEGLNVGKHNIRIQLINNEGKLIDGPFNDSGIRTIEITED